MFGESFFIFVQNNEKRLENKAKQGKFHKIHKTPNGDFVVLWRFFGIVVDRTRITIDKDEASPRTSVNIVKKDTAAPNGVPCLFSLFISLLKSCRKILFPRADALGNAEATVPRPLQDIP